MASDVTGPSRWRRLSAPPIVHLAQRGGRLSSRGRHLVVALTLGACVLGAIGWMQTDGDLGGLEVAFGTASLFVFAGTSVEQVPVALGIARLLAPMATAGATVGLLLATGEVKLHRIAARRLDGHDVVVGPVGRTAIYLAGPDDAVLVHVDEQRHPVRPGVIHLQVDLHDAGWLVEAGVARARRVVVATGSDAANLAILDRLRTALAAHPDIDVLVEVDDRSLALLLAVLSCTERWPGNVDVVCRDDLSVQRAVEVVLDRTEGSDPVAIVGDSQVFELLAEHLACALSDRNLREGGARPRLAIACGDRTMADDLGERLRAADLADTVAVSFDVTRAELRDGTVAWRSSIVDCADPSETLRVALELAVGHPERSVWVPTERGDLVAPLRPISLSGMLEAGRLVGPFTRAAQLAGARRTPSWSDLTDRERRQAVAEVRSIVAALADEGWQVDAARPGQLVGSPLPAAVVARLGADPDQRSLPVHLGRAGIRLRPPT